MFTTKFKYTIAGVIAAFIIGGLGINQVVLEKRVANLEKTPVETVKIVVSPTSVPTATPSAAIKFVPRNETTIVPKVTISK